MGNKIGWIISGVLVAVVAVILGIKLFGEPDHEDPTSATTAPGALERFAVERPVTDVLNQKPSGVGNAATEYMQAATLYDQNIEQVLRHMSARPRDDKARKIRRACKTAGNGTQLAPAGAELLTPIVASVQAGARKSSLKLVNHVTGAELDGHDPFGQMPVEIHLQNASAAALTLAGHYIYTGRHDEADEVLRAAFTMGWHLNQERAQADIVLFGLRLQQDAIRLMLTNLELAGRDRSSGKLDSYLEQLQRVYGKVSAKWGLIKDDKPHAGDIINIIENDQDRLWKIEGLLMLGFLRFLEQGHEGNLAKIDSLLEEYKHSNDPLISAAASEAAKYNASDAKRMGVTPAR